MKNEQFYKAEVDARCLNERSLSESVKIRNQERNTVIGEAIML